MKMILGLLTTVLLVAVSTPVQAEGGKSLELLNFGPGKLAAFTVRRDGHPEVRFRINGAWDYGWTNLGGTINSEVAAVSMAADRIDLFAQGTDNALYHHWFDGKWNAEWTRVGGNIRAEKPAVISRADRRLEIFVLGADRAIWLKEFDGSKWLSWKSLGGMVTSGVTALTSGDQRADIFCRGANNILYTKSSASASADFSAAWTRLGDELIDPEITVTSRSAGKIDVFARNQKKNLIHIEYADGKWGSWKSLADGLNSGPVAVSPNDKSMVVFMQGTDRAIWVRTWLGDWGSWTRISGGEAGKPVAVTSHNGVNVGYAVSSVINVYVNFFGVFWTQI